MLKSIIDVEANRVVADHVWFGYTKGFEKLALSEGIQLEFEARAKEYHKGYINTRLNINKSAIDYKLSHPSKIKFWRPTVVNPL